MAPSSASRRILDALTSRIAIPLISPAVNGEAEERTPEQVQAEIERTRAELGDTVEALVAKTDVKGQAKQAVTEARQFGAPGIGDRGRNPYLAAIDGLALGIGI